MEQYGYRRPTLPEGVQVEDLSQSVSAGPVREPAPDERVICINRGNKPLSETFDGHHRTMPASGYFEIEYAAARHFQRKLIVPGTKNLETGGWVSFIGILGVDSDENCQPFTPEQLAAFGEKVEAIDRGAFLSQEDRQTQVVRTSQAMASSPSYGMGGGAIVGRGIDVSAQATDAAREAAAHVLDRPDESLTRSAEVEAAASGRARRR